MRKAIALLLCLAVTASCQAVPASPPLLTPVPPTVTGISPTAPTLTPLPSPLPAPSGTPRQRPGQRYAAAFGVDYGRPEQYLAQGRASGTFLSRCSSPASGCSLTPRTTGTSRLATTRQTRLSRCGAASPVRRQKRLDSTCCAWESTQKLGS